MKYEIIPGRGFEDIYLDMPVADLEKLLGQPNEMEPLDDEFFDDTNEAIWHYDQYGIYPVVNIFEGKIISILSDHPDLSLRHKKIMEMNIKDIHALLKEIGFKNIEVDEEYLECEDAGLNFVFENGQMDMVDIDFIF
ncbi:MAG: hypothetical protein LBH92_04890 [Bacteroidales bacterium]|nr:hypothetical protein [Bacteroidales bacterium]